MLAAEVEPGASPSGAHLCCSPRPWPWDHAAPPPPPDYAYAAPPPPHDYAYAAPPPPHDYAYAAPPPPPRRGACRIRARRRESEAYLRRRRLCHPATVYPRGRSRDEDRPSKCPLFRKKKTIRFDFDDLDRAIVDGETRGFARVLLARGKDRILDATLVARHAGDMISEITLMMEAGGGLGRLSSVIHPYPTQGEIFRKLGDAYNRGRLTPRLKRWLERFFAWRR
jgi:hypothetical protein